MRILACAALLIACGKAADHQPPAPAPTHEDRHDQATSAPELTLEISIDGVTTTWHRDAFEKTPHFVGSNADGEARNVWSLRELVHQLVGEHARVVSITGADATQAIDPAAWADATRIPILHTTRRGTLKFRWADKDGKWGDSEVKDVAKLVVVR
ncbi:MAG: hypothetical protein JWO36_4157 [Myxococcales bacterium]|nr:hypothetical protein [Myxococcales bacterium]